MSSAVKGASLQIELGGDHPDVFVRIMSYDLTKQHDLLERFVGKRMRVTVELLEN